MPFAVWRDHHLVRQIDPDLSAWIRSQLLPKFMDDALIERDRKDAVLNAVDLKDFAELPDVFVVPSKIIAGYFEGGDPEVWRRARYHEIVEELAPYKNNWDIIGKRLSEMADARTL